MLIEWQFFLSRWSCNTDLLEITSRLIMIRVAWLLKGLVTSLVTCRIPVSRSPFFTSRGAPCRRKGFDKFLTGETVFISYTGIWYSSTFKIWRNLKSNYCGTVWNMKCVSTAWMWVVSECRESCQPSSTIARWVNLSATLILTTF
jgi:hypothetical protein